MSKTQRSFAGLLVVLLLAAFATVQPAATLHAQDFQALGSQDLAELSGTGFWSGVGCGLSIAGAIGAAVSPDPVSKLVVGTLIGAAVSCSRALFFD